MQSNNPHFEVEKIPGKTDVEPRPAFSPAGETDARQKAGEIARDAREAGEKTIREAAEQGEAMLSQQKEAFAETLHHCSDAFRNVARDLGQKQDKNLSACANIVAERLDRTSEYLKRSEFRTIRQDVERFARNKPQFFFGGLFIAGLALARFLKASSTEPEYQPNREMADYPEETFGAGHGPYSQMPATPIATTTQD
jgi:hypothetical protein